MSEQWSINFLFSSSGTLWSNDLLPASTWKIGIFLFLAAIAAKPELVSPSIKTQSGFSDKKILSMFSIIFAIVELAEFDALFK